MNAVMTNGGVFARCGSTIMLDKHESFRWHVEVHAIGAQRPYIALGGELVDNRFRGDRAIVACGCLHDDIRKYAPGAARFLGLHLSDALTGEPMHAESNAFYWLVGYTTSLGHDFGQRYHGSNGRDGKSPDRCAEILAERLRVSIPEAKRLAVACIDACPPEWREEYGTIIAKRTLSGAIDAMRPRWKAEAAECVAWVLENTSNDSRPEYSDRVRFMHEHFATA